MLTTCCPPSDTMLICTIGTPISLRTRRLTSRRKDAGTTQATKTIGSRLEAQHAQMRCPSHEDDLFDAKRKRNRDVLGDHGELACERATGQRRNGLAADFGFAPIRAQHARSDAK